MTPLPSASARRRVDKHKRPSIDARAHRRATVVGEAPAASLPRERRRAVLATFCDRRRIEAALSALPRLGFSVAHFGVLGTPASFETLLAGRFRVAPIHHLGPFLVLEDAFAEPDGSCPVIKALSRLPGRSDSETLLVSEGWPLPIEQASRTAFRCHGRILGAVGSRAHDAWSPSIVLGLRLSDAQSAATVCRALLAINDGPVELHDLGAH